MLQRYTDAILGSMQQDGWFGPLCLKDPEKKGIPDVWPHMIVLDYLCEYYEYTSDIRIIHLMTGFFRYNG